MLKKAPTELELGDLDTDFLGAFLSHLEDQRGNDARTRNTRLAAIRSFFGYVASHEPQHAALAQRVLAMLNKRHTRRPVDFLNPDEVEALLRSLDGGLARGYTSGGQLGRQNPDCAEWKRPVAGVLDAVVDVAVAAAAFGHFSVLTELLAKTVIGLVFLTRCPGVRATQSGGQHGTMAVYNSRGRHSSP